MTRFLNRTELVERNVLGTARLCLVTDLVAAQRVHDNYGAVRVSAAEWMDRWQQYAAFHRGFTTSP